MRNFSLEIGAFEAFCTYLHLKFYVVFQLQKSNTKIFAYTSKVTLLLEEEPAQ